MTVVTPNPLKDPTLTNLTEIDLSYMYDKIRKIDTAFAAAPTHWGMLKMMPIFTEVFIEPLIQHPEVLALINDTTKTFDVVLSQYLWTYTSAFAYKFKCPLIGVVSLQAAAPIYEMLGNPVHPILYQEIGLPYGDELSFLERVDALLYTIYYRYLVKFVILQACDELVKKYFGSDMPHLGELERNLSMLFVNTNPIIHRPRPLVPGVVEMGRMHIKPKNPLPKVSKCSNRSSFELYGSGGKNSTESVVIELVSHLSKVLLLY